MKMNRCRFVTLFLFVVLAAIPDTAETVEPKLIPENAEGVDESEGSGWHPRIRFAGNVALGQNKGVPGTADGLSVQLGYLISTGLDFLNQEKTNEWTTFLGMELAYSRTPVVDAFVKSLDKIELKSTYLYHPVRLPWLGPFVTIRLSAPMLPGYLVRSDPTNLIYLEPREEQTFNDAGAPIDDDGQVIDADHSAVTQVDGGEKISLTDAFAPLTLRESAGIFAIPLDKSWLKTDFRLGFGAWETFVQDGFVVQDNEDTEDLFELRRMQNSIQLGPELGVNLKGTYKKNLAYEASALFMQPIYHRLDVDSDLEGLELINMEFDIILHAMITEYFSVDYSFKAYKQPLIIDEWQIQNNLLLTIAFQLPSPAPPPPACPPPPECPAAEPEKSATETTTTTPAAPLPGPAAGAAPEGIEKPAADSASVNGQGAPEDENRIDDSAETDTAGSAATPEAASPEPAAAPPNEKNGEP